MGLGFRRQPQSMWEDMEKGGRSFRTPSEEQQRARPCHQGWVGTP